MTHTLASPNRPKKRFSQNFLTDRNTARRIVEAASLPEGHCVIEIGCGRGALTEPLLERPITLHGIEFDRSLIPDLQVKFSHHPGFTLHEGDVLRFTIRDLCPDGAHVVGNLPYHITSPILFWMMDQAGDVRSVTVMIQKEVADRVVAVPGSKEYGILSVVCQFYAACRRCFIVPAGAFFPRPKVDSAVVRMEFRPYPRQPKNVDTFRSVVRRSFGQRRKMLRNTIGSWIDAFVNFDLTRRPEALTVDDFIDLSDAVDPKRMNA